MNNGPGSAAGTPDVFACIRGRFVAIELKKAGGRVSKIQSYRLEQIRESGGVGVVVSSRNEFREVLDQVLTGAI